MIAALADCIVICAFDKIIYAGCNFSLSVYAYRGSLGYKGKMNGTPDPCGTITRNHGITTEIIYVVSGCTS